MFTLEARRAPVASDWAREDEGLQRQRTESLSKLQMHTCTNGCEGSVGNAGLG